MGASGVGIPRAFSWLLPIQGFVAAVVIYASIYVFGVGTIPFILAVVAVCLCYPRGFTLLTRSRLVSISSLGYTSVSPTSRARITSTLFQYG